MSRRLTLLVVLIAGLALSAPAWAQAPGVLDVKLQECESTTTPLEEGGAFTIEDCETSVAVLGSTLYEDSCHRENYDFTTGYANTGHCRKHLGAGGAGVSDECHSYDNDIWDTTWRCETGIHSGTGMVDVTCESDVTMNEGGDAQPQRGRCTALVAGNEIVICSTDPAEAALACPARLPPETA